MIITQQLLDDGKSVNGGWNVKQLNALGVDNFKHKWRRQLLGKEISEDQARQFLVLKDCHINLEKKRRERALIFEPITNDIKYQDQYKHPNWQKMRLLILKRDSFKCVNCHDRSKMLHVHHLKYNRSGLIWEVPTWYLVTLCEDCHSKEHNRAL